MEKTYDVVIIGSGPAGLGAAFSLCDKIKKIALLEKEEISSGGLRNDCKQNYTFPVGFPLCFWNELNAKLYLNKVKEILKPKILPKNHFNIYEERAKRLGVQLLDIEQYHVGTDKSEYLINQLVQTLLSSGVEFYFKKNAVLFDINKKIVTTEDGDIFHYKNLIIAPGRRGFQKVQSILEENNIEFKDNVVDIGIRIETNEENYPIVKDYYDPKFFFPKNVRTFCTNSGAAYITKEVYENFYSVNGHSLSNENKHNNLVNFALLKTVILTRPIISGQQFAQIQGITAKLIAGDNLLMQRVGDLRMGKRSNQDTFNYDLYNFKPTLEVTAGDISLAMPAKIFRDIWKAMKMLDTIVPGVLHPSTIMYYPEIKTYATTPKFIDYHFQVADGLYLIGDGAGTSRGITAAWASGIRAAEGIIKTIKIKKHLD